MHSKKTNRIKSFLCKKRVENMDDQSVISEGEITL